MWTRFTRLLCGSGAALLVAACGGDHATTSGTGNGGAITGPGSGGLTSAGGVAMSNGGNAVNAGGTMAANGGMAPSAGGMVGGGGVLGGGGMLVGMGGGMSAGGTMTNTGGGAGMGGGMSAGGMSAGGTMTGGGAGTGGGTMVGPYPTGPYGNTMGAVLANLKLTGYLDEAGTGIASDMPFVDSYSMEDVRATGAKYALVHVSEFF